MHSLIGATCENAPELAKAIRRLQAMRAVLFAIATATTSRGRRRVTRMSPQTLGGLYSYQRTW